MPEMFLSIMQTHQRAPDWSQIQSAAWHYPKLQKEPRYRWPTPTEPWYWHYEASVWQILQDAWNNLPAN